MTPFLESGGSRVDVNQQKLLNEAGIRWVSEPIRSIRLGNARGTVGHGDEESACDCVYCALRMRVHTLGGAVGRGDR